MFYKISASNLKCLNLPSKSLLLLEEETKKREQIDTYERLLSENIEEAPQSKSFWNLRVHNIFSILSKVDFSTYKVNLLQELVTNMVTSHFNEPETLQLLLKLKREKLPKLSFEDYFFLLTCFTNIDIFNIFKELYKETNTGLDLDYEYTIEQKDKEIETLKTKLKKLQQEL